MVQGGAELGGRALPALDGLADLALPARCGDGTEADAWPAKRQIAFAASVSLLNPHAILDTVGVIGTSALQYAGNARLGYAATCAAVSWAWFFGLATAGHFLGVAAGGVNLRQWLNRLSAVVMWLVALRFLWTLL